MKASTNHFFYWILPSAIVLLCMLIYFLDPLSLSQVIAPSSNREFGILENLQLLVILLIIVTIIRTMTKAQSLKLKVVLSLALLGALFVFLEEMDYGLHFYELLTGVGDVQFSYDEETDRPIRNIHNQGNLLQHMKLFAYIVLGLIILSPFLLDRLDLRSKYLNYIAPTSYLLFTLIAMVLLNQVALWMDVHLKKEGIKALDSNVSEFEELFIYYIGLLYLSEKARMLLKI